MKSGSKKASIQHLAGIRSIAGSSARPRRPPAAATEALEGYRFNEAAHGLYQLVWATYCDWYVELAKPLLAAEDEALRRETRATAGWCMARLLQLLHPMAPFVTEELWERLFEAPDGLLITSVWPELSTDLIDPEAEAELSWLTRTIGAIRSARAELNVPASAALRLRQHGASPRSVELLQKHAASIRRLANLGELELEDAPVAPQSLQVVVDETVLHAPVGDVIDLERERARLQKEIGRAEAELARTDERLANEAFLARAPAEVVERAARASGGAGGGTGAVAPGAGPHLVSTENSMLSCFAEGQAGARPVHVLRKDDYAGWLASAPAPARTWLEATGFTPKPGASTLLPGAGGDLAAALLLVGERAQSVGCSSAPRRPAGRRLAARRPATAPARPRGGARLGSRRLPLQHLSRAGGLTAPAAGRRGRRPGEPPAGWPRPSISPAT